MHELEVILVLVARSVQRRGEFKCLVLDRDGALGLPVFPVGGEDTTLCVAAGGFYELTGLEARIGQTGWVPLVQFPLVEARTRPVIGVPYGALIPAEVEPKTDGARWVNVVDVVAAEFVLDHRSILQSVAARI